MEIIFRISFWKDFTKLNYKDFETTLNPLNDLLKLTVHNSRILELGKMSFNMIKFNDIS